MFTLRDALKKYDLNYQPYRIIDYHTGEIVLESSGYMSNAYTLDDICVKNHDIVYEYKKFNITVEFFTNSSEDIRDYISDNPISSHPVECTCFRCTHGDDAYIFNFHPSEY